MRMPQAGGGQDVNMGTKLATGMPQVEMLRQDTELATGTEVAMTSRQDIELARSP